MILSKKYQFVLPLHITHLVKISQFKMKTENQLKKKVIKKKELKIVIHFPSPKRRQFIFIYNLF